MSFIKDLLKWGAVRGVRDPVTGGSVFSSGLKVVDASGHQKSNVLSFCMGGYLGAPVAVVANPYSFMFQTVLEADFDTVRFGILNADNAAVAGVKAAVGAGDTLNDTGSIKLGLNTSGQPNNGRANFLTMTFAGAGTGTLTASALDSTGATGANIGGCTCSVTWTDWMNCASVSRADGTSRLPVINGIITWPAGVNMTQMVMDGGTGWDTEGDLSNAPYLRPYRVMAASTKDAVANPAWMLVSNGGCAREYTAYPPVIVQYTLRNGVGKTLVVFGDSIAEGSGATVAKCGWHREWQKSVSTPTAPVSICNLAVAGSSMQSTAALGGWYSRINALISSFGRVNVYVPSGTPNNLSAPQTAADITAMLPYFGKLRQLVDSETITLFTGTIIPTNYAVKAYGGSDITYRVAWNTRMVSSTFNVADFDAEISSDAVDVNGQFWLPAANTADGIHPSTVGYQLMAPAFHTAWTYAKN